jgi:hypothetical protein
MSETIRPRERGRVATLVLSLFLSLGLLAGLVPRADAAAAPTQPKPTRSQKAQAVVAQKVFNAGSRRTLDYRKALRAAGPQHKVIAMDFALGMMQAGGRVTHRTPGQNRALARRLEVLRAAVRRQLLVSPGSARDVKPSRPDPGDPCAGVNAIDHFWYGWRIKIDDCKVKAVLDAAATVAFVGGFLGTVFTLDARAKAIMSVALLVVAAGAFALDRCGRRHRGVKLYKYWNAPLSGWCLSQ